MVNLSLDNVFKYTVFFLDVTPKGANKQPGGQNYILQPSDRRNQLVGES